MATQLTDMISDNPSLLVVDLDPQDRERKKAQRVCRLNVIQIPNSVQSRERLFATLLRQHGRRRSAN